ncbi:MAG: hypothetical protein NPIRA01_40830 [Nitrospirales bacterium]|nr:MAG: hypothetical protein NPIRA01_40830 [Nitrospirales bacterium]
MSKEEWAALVDRIVEKANTVFSWTSLEYETWWHGLFDTIFDGNMARFLASMFLVMAFWYGTYKQRLGLGVVCFFCAFLVAYLRTLQLLMG